MIVGLSLCLLNGGIFPIDHIPDQFRSILEREERIQMRSGSDWESSFDGKAVLNQSRTGPLYTLMLIMRQTWLQSGEGTTLFGHVFPLMSIPLMRITHCLVILDSPSS